MHVITTKGKGYHPAETDTRGTWHGTGPYKIDTGDFISEETNTPTWSEIVSENVLELARTDKRIVAITPAMPVGSKLEKFATEFPDRFFDVGIAEQHAVTLAGGLAAQGMKPFLAIYSTFLQRAYDQVVHDIARQKLNVLIGIDRAGLVGADGETHQGIFDISFLRSIPHLVIAMPKDENEAGKLIQTAYEYEEGPFALRYPRGNGKGVPVEPRESVLIGSWEYIHQPEKIQLAILTFGTTIPMAVQAAMALQVEGITVAVINARFIKPVDEEMLTDLLSRKIPILTVEEALLQGGFGSAILEFAEQTGYTRSQINRIGLPDKFIEQGSVEQVLTNYGISASAIQAKIKEILAQSEHKRAKL